MRVQNDAPAAHAGDGVGWKAGWRDWWLVGVVIVALLLSYVDRTILSLFGQTVKDALSLTDSQMGLVFGLGFIVPLALTSLIVGWAVDRYNRVAIIVIGVVVWSASTGFTGFAGSFLLLLLARGGVGMGEAVLAPAAYAMIGDRFPAERRGRAVGMVAAATTVGTGGAYVLAGGILQLLGDKPRHIPLAGLAEPWQLTFVILGLLGIPVTLLVLSLRDRRPAGWRPQRRADPAAGPGFWAYVRRDPITFLALFGACAINVAIGAGFSNWAPTLMLREFGTSPSEAGYLIGPTVLIAGVVAAPLAAELSDSWIRRRRPGGRLYGHPAMFGIIAAGAIGLCVAPNALVATVAFGLMFGAVGAINALSYAAVQDVAPGAMRGRMTAALQFATLALGISLGPSLTAFVVDHVFGDPSMLPQSILAMAAPLCALATGLSLAARRTYAASQARALDTDAGAAAQLGDPA